MGFARYLHFAILISHLANVYYVGIWRLNYGISQAENIKFTLEQQMVFFARMVGHFEVADEITPIRIDNVD